MSLRSVTLRLGVSMPLLFVAADFGVLAICPAEKRLLATASHEALTP